MTSLTTLAILIYIVIVFQAIMFLMLAGLVLKIRRIIFNAAYDGHTRAAEVQAILASTEGSTYAEQP